MDIYKYTRHTHKVNMCWLYSGVKNKQFVRIVHWTGFPSRLKWFLNMAEVWLVILSVQNNLTLFVFSRSREPTTQHKRWCPLTESWPTRTRPSFCDWSTNRHGPRSASSRSCLPWRPSSTTPATPLSVATRERFLPCMSTAEWAPCISHTNWPNLPSFTWRSSVSQSWVTLIWRVDQCI